MLDQQFAIYPKATSYLSSHYLNLYHLLYIDLIMDWVEWGICHLVGRWCDRHLLSL